MTVLRGSILFEKKKSDKTQKVLRRFQRYTFLQTYCKLIFLFRIPGAIVGVFLYLLPPGSENWFWALCSHMAGSAVGPVHHLSQDGCCRLCWTERELKWPSIRELAVGALAPVVSKRPLPIWMDINNKKLTWSERLWNTKKENGPAFSWWPLVTLVYR